MSAKTFVPRRPTQYNNNNNKNNTSSSPDDRGLPDSVSIVGLGCSSFSTFFWTQQEQNEQEAADTAATASSFWTRNPENLPRTHPRVQEWIETIEYAVNEAGITLLDTAPWYGHGISEVVIGLALTTSPKTTTNNNTLDRKQLQINTKVGRYEADPTQQFNFSREQTLASVQRSIRRMHCQYIDVLQLHDPEFAPSLDQLLHETIPAMISCREKGWCRALGMTGYPLEVQHLLLQRSMETFGTNIWDQALTYSHFNLHDQSLVNARNNSSRALPSSTDKKGTTTTTTSFWDYCRHELKLPVFAAAPLSMGLLTTKGPPDWHPASLQLQKACRRASEICQEAGLDISMLALLFALSHPDIPCTILGMRSRAEVEVVQRIARRIGEADCIISKEASHKERLKAVLTEQEHKVMEMLLDTADGPFADVARSGLYEWDGVAAAWEFWSEQGRTDIEKWQRQV